MKALIQKVYSFFQKHLTWSFDGKTGAVLSAVWQLIGDLVFFEG